MASVSLAFRVVSPLFLLMALGYLLRRVHMADMDLFERLNVLVFKVFLPAMLFESVLHSDFATSFQPRLVAFALALVVASFALAWAICARAVDLPERRGTIVQASCRTNFVLFGIPMATSMFGEGNIGVTAVLIAFVVPTYNLLSTIVLEASRGRDVPIGQVLKAIAKNPLIDATVLAFALLALGVSLPGPIDEFVGDVGQVATPLAIIVLGGTFRFSRVGANAGTLAAICACKLALLPLAFVGIGAALGYRGVELGTLLAMSASPTAVSSFAMAQQMGGDGELAGQAVVLTTALSMATIFAWVVALSGLGLLA